MVCVNYTLNYAYYLHVSFLMKTNESQFVFSTEKILKCWRQHIVCPPRHFLWKSGASWIRRASRQQAFLHVRFIRGRIRLEYTKTLCPLVKTTEEKLMEDIAVSYLFYDPLLAAFWDCGSRKYERAWEHSYCHLLLLFDYQFEVVHIYVLQQNSEI